MPTTLSASVYEKISWDYIMIYIPDSENVLNDDTVINLLSVFHYDIFCVVCHYQLAWSAVEFALVFQFK